MQVVNLYGAYARTAPEEDHHCVIATLRPPAKWRRPLGRPRTTWPSTNNDDLQSLNLGVHTAWSLGGRQEIGMFGIKSSVRQCYTLEFANKESISTLKTKCFFSKGLKLSVLSA